jgi:Conjugative transposon protein TcpC
MVRRALLERSDQAADDEALPADQPYPARSGDATQPWRQVGSVPWRGAGGRWIVWVARAVVWAVLLLIGYRGVLAIIDGQGHGSAAVGSTTTASTSAFPVTSAEAYALEFGDVYLNYSPAIAARRSQDLASFLPSGKRSELGWDGAGSQQVLDEQVANISVSSAHSAVVTLLARLSNGRLIDLGVPIYAAGRGMSVSGDPALLPGPAAAVPPAVSRAGGDRATEAALRSQLPAFFQAYAGGDHGTLARFAAPGARLTGLSGSVTFGGIDSIYAPPGGSSRTVRITVTWQVPAIASGQHDSATVGAAPASLQMTYQLTVVRQRGTWDVKSIGAAAQGSP